MSGGFEVSDVEKFPLIVIVGPTASGKTTASVDLAKKINGEIIAADSRTVYRGMDIGTAKPSLPERRGVSHFGFDLVSPDQRFSVSDFKKYAVEKISEIRSHGKYPIMVGGSGLYVDSVIFDYNFSEEKIDFDLRRELEGKTVEQLLDYCHKNNIALLKDFQNKRRLIRAIELGGAGKPDDRKKMIDSVLVFGIKTEKSELEKRIRKRAEKMIEDGLIDEFLKLRREFGDGLESMKGSAYQFAGSLAEGEISQQEFIDSVARSDMKLVKKQKTWFKRNKNILWVEREELIDAVFRKIGI